MSAPAAGRVAAVVVDYQAAASWPGCVESLLAEGVATVVVVDNGAPDRPVGRSPAPASRCRCSSPVATWATAPGPTGGWRRWRRPGRTGVQPPTTVTTAPRDGPRVQPRPPVHPGAVAALVAVLDDHPAWAIVGPGIVTPDGEVYPSVPTVPLDGGRRRPRPRWPSSGPTTASAAATDRWTPGATRGPRPTGCPAPASWPAGGASRSWGGSTSATSCSPRTWTCAGGPTGPGGASGSQPAAVVTHLEGVSRRRHPYRMLVAHHRSALRFANRTTRGWRRLALPAAAAVLGLRLVMAYADVAFRR